MEESRYFWVLDDRVLQYVKFGEFHWWEILIIVGGLSALVSYAALAFILDRRARARARRTRQLARLETWLEQLELSRSEQTQLAELAGKDAPQAVHALLADPQRFERAVHKALVAGGRVDFADRVRETLGYYSDNLSIPIASTRQLVPGDHVRLSLWEGGRPEHHYGLVAAVSPAGLSVELTDAGFKAARSRGGELELFYLRDNDVEYRFPYAIRGEDAAHNRILLHHHLLRGGQRPRGTRLPMMRQVVARLHTQLAGATTTEPGPKPAVPPAGSASGIELWRGATQDARKPPAAVATSEEVRAALLEMSEGGFSMLLLQPVAEGAYLEFPLALPRGRSLKITGRVLDCRPFAGNRWLVRCEQRGLSRTQRNTLSQLLRLEQQRRIKAMEAERRKRRHAESDPA